jgi:predicted dehydrogenase
MKKYACSIVGLGRIASLLEDDPLREKPATHAAAISSNPDCVLLSGCDSDPEKRKLFSERWGCQNVFETIEELFEAGSPDILVIATPQDSHEYYALCAIDHGVPLVICEKPLSENLREAKRIAHFAMRSDTVLMVNHERRYSKDYIGVKRIVEEGKYGKFLSLSARLCMGFSRTVREMLFEDGTHLVDIIRFLTGAEFGINSVVGNPDDSGGSLVAVGKSGVVRTVIEASCDRDHLVFEMTLGFERGRVVVGNGVYEEYVSGKSPHYEGFRSLEKKIDTVCKDTGYFMGMLSDAVAVLGDPSHARKPVSAGIGGYMAIKTIHDILKKCKNVG